MKIYFEDGKLDCKKFQRSICIDAGLGVSHCRCMFDYYSNVTIYTNSPLAFASKYVWDTYTKTPEIYLRNRSGKWKRIDCFTDRLLHKGMNLWKLYLAGEFDED